MIAGKKGQGIAIDFLFAVLVFLLVLNACMIIIDSSKKSVSDKSILNELDSVAVRTIDMLVRTDGQPNDWQQKGINEATAIGLARRDRTLDEEKVGKFAEWAGTYRSADYNKTKSLLLMGYDYYFTLTDTAEPPNVVATAEPSADVRDNSVAVNVKRIVNFKGEEMIAELTIYYPRP